MQLSEVKRAILSGQIVTMNGFDAFAGIRYRVEGIIMRCKKPEIAADNQNYQWVYYAELADKSGCITVAPLHRVTAVKEGDA